MSVYAEPPTAFMVRRALATIAADSWLTSYFGARISDHPIESLTVPIRGPILLVIPDTQEVARECGGKISMTFPIIFRAVLPAPTPATKQITAPAAPTVAAGSTGVLTGTYRWLLTEVSSIGESYVSEPSAELVVSTKAPVLTLPTPGATSDGWRVWRNPTGYTRYHYAGTARRGDATYTDNLPDAGLGDELAPVPDLGRVIQAKIEQALYQTDVETLSDGVKYGADASLLCEPQKPLLLARRNLMAYDVRAKYPSRYNPKTMELDVGGVV